MTFHLGLLFSSAQCFSLAFHVFWVLIFHITRTGIITWGGLASLWPDLLFFLVTLVSFWEWWADGNGTSLPTFFLWKLHMCFPNVSSSIFPFQFISIPILFLSSNPSCCRSTWRGLFLSSLPQEQEQQQHSAQTVWLGSLAWTLLTTVALEAEGVVPQMKKCTSDAVLVKNHLQLRNSKLLKQCQQTSL